MKLLSTVAAAALAVAISTPAAMAASDNASANGKGNSAAEYAPGQMKKKGTADTAREAAPGQKMKAGEVDSAREAAPGQIKLDNRTTASINNGERVRIVKTFEANRIDPVATDFDLVTGAEVPSSYSLKPLPSDAIVIAPSYEGYSYFYTNDGRYVIVDTNSRAIVDIL